MEEHEMPAERAENRLKKQCTSAVSSQHSSDSSSHRGLLNYDKIEKENEGKIFSIMVSFFRR